MLNDVYNSETGLLRKVQDHFLYSIKKEQLCFLLGKDDISFEEELLVQSVLIKAYLVNFRELMLPFYRLDDEVFIKFKTDRINFLSERS